MIIVATLASNFIAITGFKNIALAFAFSPTLEGLIAQVKMLAGRFGASIVFIHVGVPMPEQMKLFAGLLEKHGYRNQDYKMVFREGDVQNVIWDVCTEEHVDLLVSGALRKESPEHQYFGSIARGLAGNPSWPLLLLPEPGIPARVLDTIIAAIPAENPAKTIETALYFARQNNSKTLYFTQESIFKADPITLKYYTGKDGFGDAALTILDMEYAHINEILKAYNQEGLNVHTKVVFGHPGSGVVSFAKETGADLIIDALPQVKESQSAFGYAGDIEVILMNLPCNFLLLD